MPSSSVTTDTHSLPSAWRSRAAPVHAVDHQLAPVHHLLEHLYGDGTVRRRPSGSREAAIRTSAARCAPCKSPISLSQTSNIAEIRVQMMPGFQFPVPLWSD